MYEILARFLPTTRLFTNEPLAKHTSFKVGGPADVYVLPENATELCHILEQCRNHNAPFTLLGHGSNVLVSDAGLRGVVIQLYPHFNTCRVLDEHRVQADAGSLLSTLAETACRAGLSGLAFASGIPGTVGGAVYMNAGAYDHNIQDVCESVDVFTPSGERVMWLASEMDFGYRHSVLQENGGLVLSAVFRLEPGDPAKIRQESNALNERRRASQPLEYPSAGSVFKRPPGFFAGKLIADSGLKGFSIGGAQVSEKHAGFIINTGNATASDILRLIEHVRQTVYQQFGVMLEPEIRMLG